MVPINYFLFSSCIFCKLMVRLREAWLDSGTIFFVRPGMAYGFLSFLIRDGTWTHFNWHYNRSVASSVVCLIYLFENFSYISSWCFWCFLVHYFNRIPKYRFWNSISVFRFIDCISSMMKSLSSSTFWLQ